MAKVYVSSTLKDLQAERDAVMAWLVARGHQPVHSYTPAGETVRESCLADIDSCDLYVVIVGHRYGLRPADDNPERLSITQLEFRRAAHLPRIALLKTTIDAPRSDVGNPELLAKVLAFREEVARAVRPAEFADHTGLVIALSTGVEKELSPDPAGAWLAAQTRALAIQFAERMPSIGDPEALYLDLVVADRGGIPRPLEEVLAQASGPLVLTGEGGAGKSTALLHLAACLANRALTDTEAPIPIYVDLGRLTAISDVADLQRLIADAVPIVADWSALVGLEVLRRRRVLYLLDAFNEMPEHLQRTALAVLSRFIDKHRDRAGFLLVSRFSPLLEHLVADPAHEVFEVLRLRPTQVRGFLERLGLGSLYERMPAELRDLAGNPFMLVAIARTLAATAAADLPRNRGRLYEQFIRGWMRREEDRRACKYHFERVKLPLLGDLATRMTASGKTSLTLDEPVSELIEQRLTAIYDQIRRRGGMPADWTVDGFVAELVDDGLLRRTGVRLQFLHQSVQEYLAACHFAATDAAALTRCTPRIDWARIDTTAGPELPNHRLVPALLMLVGVLPDATAVVDELAERHPLLAAAAMASASRVQVSSRRRLTETWTAELRHPDRSHRAVACACITASGTTEPDALQQVVAMALDGDGDTRWIAHRALGRWGANEHAIRVLVQQSLDLPNNVFEDLHPTIGNLIEDVVPEMVADVVLQRAVHASEDERGRLGALLAMVPEPDRDAAKRKLTASGTDTSVIAATERVLRVARSSPKRPSLGARLVRRSLDARARQLARIDEMASTLSDRDDDAVVGALRSTDPTAYAAALRVATDRRLPVADLVLDGILHRHDDVRAEEVAALRALTGTDRALQALAAHADDPPRTLGVLAAEHAPGPNRISKLSDGAAAELERLAPGAALTNAYPLPAERGQPVWALEPPSGSTLRFRYTLQASDDGLTLVDHHVAARAVNALRQIDAEATTACLRDAAASSDPSVVAAALRGLADRGDTTQVDLLIARARDSSTPDAVVNAILDGLERLAGPSALRLLDDLLATEPSPQRLFLANAAVQIHKILVAAGADDDIRTALEAALDAERSRDAALREYGRWFGEHLPPDRAAAWRRPEIVRRVGEFALRSPEPAIRAAASTALASLPTATLRPLLATALAEDDAAVWVAAGEVDAAHSGPFDPDPDTDLQQEIGDRMLAVTRGGGDLDLRQRAARVLRELPGALDALYQPISAAFEADIEPAVALKRADALIELLPDDVNGHWWRGHALRLMDRIDDAAASFEAAFDLDSTLSVVGQALAEMFVDTDAPARAVEWARRAVAADAFDPEAQAILAATANRAAAPVEASRAARRALMLDPVDEIARWALVLALLQQGDLAACQIAYEEARRLDQLLLTTPGLWVRHDLDALEGLDADARTLADEIRATLV